MNMTKISVLCLLFLLSAACDRTTKIERLRSGNGSGVVENQCLVAGCDAKGVEKGPINYGEDDQLAAESIGSEKYFEPLQLTEQTLKSDSSACQHVVLTAPTEVALYASLEAITTPTLTVKSGTLMKAEEFVENGPEQTAPDRAQDKSRTWLRLSNGDGKTSVWVNSLYARCR